MCTAIVSVDPASPVPVLLAGVRDEFIARSWVPPGRHWPGRPGLVGGRDLRAGGTWLAVDPDAPRASTVLNGHGRTAPEAGRASRGELPLRVAAEGKLGEPDLARFDPFHLIGAEPDRVRLWSWDGEALLERDLGPGLHLVVNSGLEGEGGGSGDAEDVYIRARLGHFRPRFAGTARPGPGTGPGTGPRGTAREAWDGWLDLLDGGGVPRADPRALLPMLDLGGGRVWGTTSVSLVALSRTGARYDFSAAPGDPGAWSPVL